MLVDGKSHTNTVECILHTCKELANTVLIDINPFIPRGYQTHNRAPSWLKDAATVYTNTRSCTPGYLHTGGWRKLSASSEFLNFENWTIIKGDMAKNVSEDKI